MPTGGWRITTQVTDQLETTLAGAVLAGVRVYYITGAGNESSVFIANQHYNVANVRKAVAASAALLDEVGQLAEGITGQA